MQKFLLILFSLCSWQLIGQQATDSSYFEPAYRHGVKYIFKTSAGTIFKGFVRDETAEFVTVENRDVHETYELKRKEIVYAKPYTDAQTYTDLVLGENYHAGNYMLAQSAFLFREGRVASTSHLFLLDNVEYAFSENWAITANTLAFFYPISIGVKCAYAIDDMNYAGGNIFGIGIRGSNNGSGLYGYGVLGKYTRGTSNNNFTLFGGVIGLNSDILFNRATNIFVNTAFMGGAYCKRLSQRVALNVEGWYLPEITTGMAGIGIKLVGNEVTCWTFGCYTFLSNYNNNVQVNLRTLPLPYFGITRNFN